jgi:hypothetical protein
LADSLPDSSPTVLWYYNGVLHEFLTANRAIIIDRCRITVAARSEPKTTDYELIHGIPIVLDPLWSSMQHRIRRLGGEFHISAPCDNELITTVSIPLAIEFRR